MLVTHVRQNGRRLTITDRQFEKQMRYVLKVKLRNLRKASMRLNEVSSVLQSVRGSEVHYVIKTLGKFGVRASWAISE